MGLKVYNSPCHNCLLSENRIVSPTRAQEIIKSCIHEQSHFICHKASIEDKEILCNTFYEKLGHHSQAVRIAQRLDLVEFVDQPDGEPLTPFHQQ